MVKYGTGMNVSVLVTVRTMKFNRNVGKFRRNQSTKPNNTKKNADMEDGGYMKRRLEQLAEDAFPSSSDAIAGIPKDALPYNKIELHEKLDKIQNDPSNFRYQHQQAIGVSKLPSSASKQTRDIAMAKPWNGVEYYHDASLRMLNDSYKPIKIVKSKSKINLKNGNTIITPPQPIRNRIHNAKEGALDYQLAKVSLKDIKKGGNENEEEDGWAEMYRERLLGPSMLLNDSFASVDNSIKSLADQRIMDAQRRGEFKNIKRGKPLNKGYSGTENIFIDRTEYHLNEILKKQDALPPWIEKQGGCDIKISNFRYELDQEWLKWSLNQLKDEYPDINNELLIKKMEIYAKNEINGEGKLLRSEKWLNTRGKYFESKVRDLNDTIRGYNLQAPMASQKLYLILDKELNSCYKRIAPILVDSFKKHIEKSNIGNVTHSNSYHSIPQRENVYQQKTESLSSMFKKLLW